MRSERICTNSRRPASKDWMLPGVRFRAGALLWESLRSRLFSSSAAPPWVSTRQAVAPGWYMPRGWPHRKQKRTGRNGVSTESASRGPHTRTIMSWAQSNGVNPEQFTGAGRYAGLPRQIASRYPPEPQPVGESHSAMCPHAIGHANPLGVAFAAQS